MSNPAVLRMVDAVTVPVPDIDQGLEFYRDHLGHELLWRNDEVGQAGLRLPESRTELVLSTSLQYVPNWLVTSVDEAVEIVVTAGGTVLTEPTQIPVGRLAVVTDPFGNALILLDLSAGHYVTDARGCHRCDSEGAIAHPLVRRAVRGTGSGRSRCSPGRRSTRRGRSRDIHCTSGGQRGQREGDDWAAGAARSRSAPHGGFGVADVWR